ncbi:hypothetical protein Tco_0671548 [Tanacetum coccineum]
MVKLNPIYYTSQRAWISESKSAAAEYAYLSAALLPANPAHAESIQQSPHLSGSQSADPAQPEHQPAPICLQHEPSGTPPTSVPQYQKPAGRSP